MGCSSRQPATIPVVAVGKATEKTLQKFGIPITPSKATAKVLAQELESKGEGTTLLYLASVRAQDTLESGLMARGFAVTRLNTYDTITATWSEEQKEKAKKVKVACFASPSSIKEWLSNTGDSKDVTAACIGETSANAYRGHSWSESQFSFPPKVPASRDGVIIKPSPPSKIFKTLSTRKVNKTHLRILH